jgi:glucose/arabinose dehydrogenase
VREVPLTSAVFRIPADASDVVIPGDEAELNESGYLFADGLRNSYDLEFSPEGELFAGDNGPDADFPDELNWIREGHHYGFPWRFGAEANPQASPDYDPSQDKRLPEDFVAVQRGTYENDPEFPPPPDVTFTEPVANLGPDGDQYRAEDGSQQDASEQGEPLHTFTPHRSPLGLSFDKDGALGGDWQDSAFILSWGSAGGTLTDKGQDLLALKLTKDGENYTAEVRQIARGFENPIDSVLIENKLYVLDYGGDGAIWELTFP